jgi:amino acid transporter
LTSETSPGADSHEQRPSGRPTLRRNYISGFENVAQTLGTLAPTGTLGVVIPLVIGLSGNGTWLLVLGVVGIFILILFNINVFARRGASAGGLGTYPGIGIGPRAGAFTKWTYLIAMLFGAAGCAPSSAYYACILITQTTGIPNTALLGAAVTTLVVIASWWIAFRDIKLSSDVMIVIEVTSLTVIVAIIALAMARGGPWIDRPQLTLQGAGPRTFSAGLVLAFIMMGGFESATTLGEESKHAERTIPRALVGCVVPIGLLYVVMTYLLVGLGRKFGIALDQLDAPFDSIARACHMPLLGKASSLGIALSYFACTLGSLNAGARTLYSLAEDGLFFEAFADAHPKNATPHRAIALLSAISIATPVGVLMAGCTLVACIDYISQLAALGFIGTYFMVCLAAPFYLSHLGCLRWPALTISVTTLVLLAGVMIQSVYPVQPAPACYLPYVFAAIVACGLALSWQVRRHVFAAGPAGSVP